MSTTHGVQIETPIQNINHQHPKFEETVERAKALFLGGWKISLGLSGKDSGAASVCIVEGLLRASAINPEHGGALHVVTTNTTLDNMVLHDYMMQLHEDMRHYAQEHNLPIYTHELKPSLSRSPMVEYIGKGKILRTAANTNGGRTCAIDWKILPLKRFLAQLKKQYKTTKIVSISGSRESESKVRAKSLSKRSESATEMVLTDVGWTQPIIKDWTLNNVWQLFKIIDDGDIESYSDRFDCMKKHYAAGNGGVCDLFAGDTKNKNASKSCGSRFGCTLCAVNGERDSSLEAQIETDPKTYGFMEPLNKMREFMLNGLYDYNNRSIEGRTMKDGFIKVAVNHYSIEYRMDLLRYVLSMQVEAFHKHGYHPIDLVDYEQLLAIQYYWSRECSESEPGMALKIWHEIVTTEEKSYPIPVIEKVEKGKAPTARYLDLQALLDSDNPIGLDDESLEDEFKEAKAHYTRDGKEQQVIRYNESQLFSVVTKDGLAMDFVEDFYPYLVAEGHLFNKCPSVMLKHLIESGVVELIKGAIAKLHEDTKRGQVLHLLGRRSKKTNAGAILDKSVGKKEMEAVVLAKKASIIKTEINEPMKNIEFLLAL
jgi:DNA sulfur modification protein DndC